MSPGLWTPRRSATRATYFFCVDPAVVGSEVDLTLPPGYLDALRQADAGGEGHLMGFRFPVIGPGAARARASSKESRFRRRDRRARESLAGDGPQPMTDRAHAVVASCGCHRGSCSDPIPCRRSGSRRWRARVERIRFHGSRRSLRQARAGQVAEQPVPRLESRGYLGSCQADRAARLHRRGAGRFCPPVRARFVVGLGGGSCLDLAKAVALAQAADESLPFYGENQIAMLADPH